MNNDRFLCEFLATNLWRDKSKQQPHKENHDRFGRVGGCGGNCGGWCKGESGTIGEILGDTKNCGSSKRTEYLLVAFRNGAKTTTPFWFECEDEEIAKTFTEEDKSHFGKEVEFGVGGVLLDENKVAGDGDGDK